MSDKLIFAGYGCEVLLRDEEYFIRYDSGEAAGSKIVESQISKEEASEAELSEFNAYQVVLRAQKRSADK